MTRRRLFCTRFLFAAAVSPVLSGADALAQTSRPAEVAPTTMPATAPAAAPAPSLLSGPRVVPDAVDPSQPSFGDRDARRRTVEVRPQRWFRLLMELDIDTAQKAEIEKHTRAYGRATRVFQREHGPALRDLRRKLRAAQERGGDVPKELRESLRELQKKRPPVEETQKTLWELLTPEQQDAFRTLLDEEKKRMAERVRKRRGGAKPAKPDGDATVDDGDVTERRLRFLRSRRRGAGDDG